VDKKETESLSHIESKLRIYSPEKNFAILLFSKVTSKINPCSFRNVNLLNRGIAIISAATSSHNILDVEACLLNIPFNIHSESECFKNS